MTVWVYLKSYGQVIIDNKSTETGDDEGYFWMVNDSGYQVFMSGDNDSNDCDWNSSDCFVVCSTTVPKW